MDTIEDILRSKLSKDEVMDLLEGYREACSAPTAVSGLKPLGAPANGSKAREVKPAKGHTGRRRGTAAAPGTSETDISEDSEDSEDGETIPGPRYELLPSPVKLSFRGATQCVLFQELLPSPVKLSFRGATQCVLFQELLPSPVKLSFRGATRCVFYSKSWQENFTCSGVSAWFAC
jgi:hypothetical protein